MWTSVSPWKEVAIASNPAEPPSVLSLVVVGCEPPAAQALVRHVLRANRAGDRTVIINALVVRPGRYCAPRHMIAI